MASKVAHLAPHHPSQARDHLAETFENQAKTGLAAANIANVTNNMRELGGDKERLANNGRSSDANLGAGRISAAVPRTRSPYIGALGYYVGEDSGSSRLFARTCEPWMHMHRGRNAHITFLELFAALGSSVLPFDNELNCRAIPFHARGAAYSKNFLSSYRKEIKYLTSNMILLKKTFVRANPANVPRLRSSTNQNAINMLRNVLRPKTANPCRGVTLEPDERPHDNLDDAYHNRGCAAHFFCQRSLQFGSLRPLPKKTDFGEKKYNCAVPTG